MLDLLELSAARRGQHKRPPRHLRPGDTSPHGMPTADPVALRERFADDVCACSHTRADHYRADGASASCASCSCRAYGRAT